MMTMMMKMAQVNDMYSLSLPMILCLYSLYVLVHHKFLFLNHNTLPVDDSSDTTIIIICAVVGSVITVIFIALVLMIIVLVKRRRKNVKIVIEEPGNTRTKKQRLEQMQRLL